MNALPMRSPHQQGGLTPGVNILLPTNTLPTNDIIICCCYETVIGEVFVGIFETVMKTVQCQQRVSLSPYYSVNKESLSLSPYYSVNKESLSHLITVSTKSLSLSLLQCQQRVSLSPYLQCQQRVSLSPYYSVNKESLSLSPYYSVNKESLSLSPYYSVNNKESLSLSPYYSVNKESLSLTLLQCLPMPMRKLSGLMSR